MTNILNKLKTFFNPPIEEFRPSFVYQPLPLGAPEKDADWNNKMEFVYRESKEFLTETVAAIDYIKNKILILILVLFSVSVLSGAKIISLLTLSSVGTIPFASQLITFLALLIAGYLTVLTALAYFGFRTSPYHAKGIEPKNHFVTEFINQHLSVVFVAEAVNNQTKISLNVSVMKKISFILSVGLLAAAIVPFISLIISFVYFFICHLLLA